MGEVLAGVELALEMTGAFDFGGSSAFLVLPTRSLLPQGLSIVSLPPLPEGRCIHLDDGTLHQRLCSHQLIVACIVGDINDPRLPRDGLGAPGKVASVKAKGTTLDVATAHTHFMDALGTDTGVGGLTAKFKFALLAVVGALGTGVGSFMT